MNWFEIQNNVPCIGQKVWFYTNSGIKQGIYNDNCIFENEGHEEWPLVIYWQPYSGPRKIFGPLVPQILESNYPNKQALIDFLKSPNPFSRDNLEAHFTGSTWLFNNENTKVLLMKHKKLGIWLQMGGHIEDGENIWEAAKRELLEESGIPEEEITMGTKIISINSYNIPEHKGVPEHIHHDVSFSAHVDETKVYLDRVNKVEGLEMKWFSIDALPETAPTDLLN